MASVVTDPFTNSNGTALSPTHNANVVYLHGADFRINSNRVNPGINDEIAAYYNLTFSNDQYAQLVLSALANGIYIGPGCRESATGYYGLYSDLVGDYTLFKFIISGAVWTALATASPAAVGNLLYIEANGSAIKGVKAGVTSFGGPVTDSSLTTGKGGIVAYGNSASSSGDDLDAGDFGGGVTGRPIIIFRPMVYVPMDNMR